MWMGQGHSTLSAAQTLTHPISPFGAPVRFQTGTCSLGDVGVDNDGPTHTEDFGADVASVRRYILAREDEMDDPLHRVRLRFILEPDDGGAVLVPELKRTPLLRRVDDLRLLVLEFLLEDAVQDECLPCCGGPVGSLPRGPTGPC